jgi:hypothetical protein
MWAIAVKLALGGFNILKVIGGWIAAGARALNIQGWIGLAGALVLGFFLLQQKGETRHWKKQSGQFEKLYHGEQAAFGATVSLYRAAVEKARADDAKNKARVEAEQRSINERTSHDFEARIAAARATADRMRHDLAAAANSGRSGIAPVSGVSSPAARPAQAAGEDGFPLDDRLTATEQAIQLDELIKWVKKQAAVDVNGAKKP